MTDIHGMKEAGAKAISEDGKSVMNAQVYREAMKEAAKEGLLVMAHCEDKNMVGKGAMNAGKKAEELGMCGITNGVEDVIVARDILLAKETGARLHLCHCSTVDSVHMIREARKIELPVSGEVCPHHFSLTQDDIPGDDANYKMNPPLREQGRCRGTLCRTGRWCDGGDFHRPCPSWGGRKNSLSPQHHLVS